MVPMVLLVGVGTLARTQEPEPPVIPWFETRAPGAFGDSRVAASEEWAVAFRVDATIRLPLLIAKIPIASRENVGVTTFSVRHFTTDRRTGVRAYERNGDLRANNDRLLEYVEAGGTLIVQYNKFEFNEAQYGPYPVQVSRARVTDEYAPVRILAPDHPLFGFPNQISDATWADWVQERGLYFLGDKDPAYLDLVELSDPFPSNPGVKHGALVEARYGEGRWLYVGLGLWRQLPAGTAGAPMLEVLRGAGLSDTAVVVTRWFGGTLLGAGGLVRAYGDAVRHAVARAGLLERRLRSEVEVDLDHAEAGRVETELRSRGVDVLETAYGARVRVLLGVDPEQVARTEGLLAELTSGAARPVVVGQRWVDGSPAAG